MISSEKPLFSLLQISDLHFGPPYLDKTGEALLHIAPQLKPDAIIVSGDLTQRAKREQFVAAAEFLKRLPNVPRLVIPGNHDVPLYRVFERILRPHSLYRELISEDLNPVLRIPGAVIAGLDTTAPLMAISNGRISRWQLDACEKVFHDVPQGTARIIVAHHHFAPAPDYLRDSSMPRSRRAMTRFSEWKIDMILGGHLHRAFIGNSLDFYPGLRRDRGIIIAQCGTTTSQRGRGREREKNSFNFIQFSESTISITHYMFFHASNDFQAVSQHTFVRGTITPES